MASKPKKPMPRLTPPSPEFRRTTNAFRVVQEKQEEEERRKAFFARFGAAGYINQPRQPKEGNRMATKKSAFDKRMNSAMLAFAKLQLIVNNADYGDMDPNEIRDMHIVQNMIGEMRDKFIFHLNEVLGISQTDIGAMFGITGQRTGQIVKKIRLEREGAAKTQLKINGKVPGKKDLVAVRKAMRDSIAFEKDFVDAHARALKTRPAVRV